ncbi:MAG: haloacid dehalogenase type II [Beijerinckiaceae bacterium]
MLRLTDFKCLTFDCYGTLIDWETGMFEALKPLTSRVLRPLSRDQVLEAHARHESFQQAQTPQMRYRDILPIVYKRLGEEWGVETPWSECVTYGLSVGEWPAFADTAGALQYLKKFYKLVILSNVDNENFSRSNQKLGVTFDAIFAAEDIGSYKPDQRNFDYMFHVLEQRGIARSEILHTAESMFHDHKPARKAGLANCWIYRRFDKSGFGATMHPGDMPTYDFQFNSMADLAKAHQEELRRTT